MKKMHDGNLSLEHSRVKWCPLSHFHCSCNHIDVCLCCNCSDMLSNRFILQSWNVHWFYSFACKNVSLRFTWGLLLYYRFQSDVFHHFIVLHSTIFIYITQELLRWCNRAAVKVYVFVSGSLSLSSRWPIYVTSVSDWPRALQRQLLDCMLDMYQYIIS